MVAMISILSALSVHVSLSRTILLRHLLRNGERGVVASDAENRAVKDRQEDHDQPCRKYEPRNDGYRHRNEELIKETFYQCQKGGNTLVDNILQPLCSAYEHPRKETAVQEHRSRFTK